MIEIIRSFSKVWTFRQFILGNVRREFQARYKNSLLGSVWTVLNPLSQIFIYTVVFSQIMKARLPGVDTTFGYSIFLCSGIIIWGLFSEITTKCQSMFLDNANLIKKVSFPKLCIPITIIINALINFAVIFSLFTIFLLVTGNFPGLALLAMIPLLSVLILFALGLGMIIGIMNVFFRDIGHFYSIALTFWFWLTPIVYPGSILPESVQKMIVLNPMSGFVGEVQKVMVYGQWPGHGWIYLGALAIVLGFFSMRLFRKRASDLVDEL